MDSRQQILAGGVLIAVAGWVYLRNTTSKAFNNDGDYKHVSPMKHDIIKQLTLNLFPLLVIGIFFGAGQENAASAFSQTLLGRSVLEILAYFAFYQIVEPYFANRFMDF